MRKTTIGEKINDFIAYKRSLGYVYDTAERYLKHYQRHMEVFAKSNPKDCSSNSL